MLDGLLLSCIIQSARQNLATSWFAMLRFAANLSSRARASRSGQPRGRWLYQEILAAFASRKPEDVQAAIAFAAASGEPNLPIPLVPSVQCQLSSTRTCRLLATSLENLGHETHMKISRAQTGLAGGPTMSQGSITQDLNFSNLRKFAPGSHSRILLMRLRSPHRRELLAGSEKIFP